MNDFDAIGDHAIISPTEQTRSDVTRIEGLGDGTSGLSSAHKGGKPHGGNGNVEWSEGARYCQMRYSGPSKRGPGGIRGPIASFSPASRRRLIRTVMSINLDRIDMRACYFVGITYPANFTRSPEDWVQDRNKLADRFRYRWGWSAIWRLEFQDRDAPHYHLIVIGDDPSVTKLNEFRTWLSRAWYDIVGSKDPKHLSAGTHARPVDTWDAVCWYTAKPVTGEQPVFVDEETGEILSIGRTWGKWGTLPIDRRVETLSDKGFFWMRRALTRYKRWQSRKRRAGLSTLAPNTVVERLVAAAKHMVDSVVPEDREVLIDPFADVDEVPLGTAPSRNGSVEMQNR